MVGAIVGLIVIGVVGGYAARAMVPGHQEMTVVQSLLLGVAGAFIGGVLCWMMFDIDGGFIQTASWAGSIVGAAILLGLRAMFDDYRHHAITRY